MMTALIHKITYLIPATYIIIILYFRLLAEKPVRNIGLFMTDFQLIIAIVVIICLTIRLRSTLKKYGFIEQKPSWFNFRIKEVFLNWFNALWVSFFQLLLDNFLFINFLLLALNKDLINDEKRKIIVNAVIFLDYLPRFLLIFIFLTEILIYQKLNYFYKSSFLFLLPLSLTVIEKMLMQFYAENFPVSCTNIELINSADGSYYKFVDSYVLPDFVENIRDYITNIHLPLSLIPNIMLEYLFIKEELEKYLFDFLFTLLYLFGWCFILYFGCIKYLFI